MKAKIFYLIVALVLVTGLAVAAVPSASVQAADEDRDNFEVIVNENDHGYDYSYECTLSGAWVTHDFPLIDYQTDPPDPNKRSLTGLLVIKIENNVTPWSGFDPWGQLAVDYVEIYRDTELLDRVDIGDPVSEATHSLSEWGPIQPDASGGYYGDLANGGSPDYTSVDKKCRVTHFPGGAEDWAAITLDAGEVIANRLVMRVLDGMTGTPPPSGCFIATAAYGTSTAEEIDTLRAFRDEVMLENSLGSQLVNLYYEVSPPVADFISEHDVLRTLVRELLVDPVAWLVEATGTLWRD